MSEQGIGVEKLQELIRRGPFNQWLNFTVTKAEADGIEVKAVWRDEWVVNPERRYTHGGILAAIVDVAADFAIAARLGRPVRAIELRVDCQQAAMQGGIYARGRGVSTWS